MSRKSGGHSPTDGSCRSAGVIPTTVSNGSKVAHVWAPDFNAGAAGPIDPQTGPYPTINASCGGSGEVLTVASANDLPSKRSRFFNPILLPFSASSSTFSDSNASEVESKALLGTGTSLAGGLGGRLGFRKDKVGCMEWLFRTRC